VHAESRKPACAKNGLWHFQQEKNALTNNEDERSGHSALQKTGQYNSNGWE
jgi:hypothetical protein